MPRLTYHLPNRHRANRLRAAHAFTLVELLVSITILVILATVTLYGMASVQKMAQIQRAKSQIARIHELIMEKWETYELRSVRTIPPYSGLVQADMRLLGIRELMRFELPDRKSDLYHPNGDPALVVLDQLPALARYYIRRAPFTSWSVENESAECLYLILSRMTVGDASALEFFSEEEIGDTDAVPDGMPEILDPWGRPITFIRWPSGYSSSAAVTLNEVPDPGQAALSADPFDLTNREPQNLPSDNDGRIPHAIFPLIVSAGPDGERALLTDLEGVGSTTPLAQRFRYSETTVFRRASLADPNGPIERPWPNDPYGFESGLVGGPGAKDNVTNHLISTGIK